jgi:hypothetical protein
VHQRIHRFGHPNHAIAALLNIVGVFDDAFIHDHSDHIIITRYQIGIFPARHAGFVNRRFSPHPGKMLVRILGKFRRG